MGGCIDRHVQGHLRPERILGRHHLVIGAALYFYELHEGEDEIYSDLLLVHDTLFPPDEFFEMVQAIRRRVQETYEDDTLIEAVAVELEREHGFTFVSDARLTASVNVSTEEAENYLTDLEGGTEGREAFRTLYADLDLDGASEPN